MGYFSAPPIDGTKEKYLECAIRNLQLWKTRPDSDYLADFILMCIEKAMEKND